MQNIEIGLVRGVNGYTFSALTLYGWVAEGHLECKKTEWWDACMVMCLGQGADLHMAQLMSLPLIISSSSKSRFVLLSSIYLSGAGSPGSPGHNPRWL